MKARPAAALLDREASCDAKSDCQDAARDPDDQMGTPDPLARPRHGRFLTGGESLDSSRLAAAAVKPCNAAAASKLMTASPAAATSAADRLESHDFVLTRATAAPPPAHAWPLALEPARQHLCRSDARIAALMAQHGPPKFVSSFETADSGGLYTSLIKTIVYQQLAGAAAQTIWLRFLSLMGHTEEHPVLQASPARVLALREEEMRKAGLSARKLEYIQHASRFAMDGHLDEAKLHAMSDEAVVAQLTTIKGVGVWSAHMLMMFSLGRPDVLATGDLGIRKGFAVFFGGPGGTSAALPDAAAMEEQCRHWRPFRSVASSYMWHVGAQHKSAERRTKSKPAAVKKPPAVSRVPALLLATPPKASRSRHPAMTAEETAVEDLAVAGVTAAARAVARKRLKADQQGVSNITARRSVRVAKRIRTDPS